MIITTGSMSFYETYVCNFFPDNSSKEEETNYVEPEQLNLLVLRTATNNFSKENKLGEGGFGEVFKVHLFL